MNIENDIVWVIWSKSSILKFSLQITKWLLKQNCKIEFNLGDLSTNVIDDSNGNGNKGFLIGDYKIKKNRKNKPMTRDSFIKIPKKTNNRNGAL